MAAKTFDEACAHALDVTALALLGEPADVRHRAEQALILADPLESRSVAVFVRRAIGLAAAAQGDYATAYVQFRSAFTDDGEPVHCDVSHTVLAELAAAAVRRGRQRTPPNCWSDRLGAWVRPCRHGLPHCSTEAAPCSQTKPGRC
ncbi:hypothetical protein ABZ816_38035 [Actinosynnema sp. NPDC047251]